MLTLIGLLCVSVSIVYLASVMKFVFSDFSKTDTDTFDDPIDSLLEPGIYRPDTEDLSSYLNDRALEDRIAMYDPYADTEYQEMLNG